MEKFVLFLISILLHAHAGTNNYNYYKSLKLLFR